MTQEAYDKLQHELDQLSGPGRADVTAKIAAAREEGDLRENGGYHAAREEQGKQEARIRQLADMLRRAEVGEAPVTSDEVAPGTKITIAFDGDEYVPTPSSSVRRAARAGLRRRQRLQPAGAAGGPRSWGCGSAPTRRTWPRTAGRSRTVVKVEPFGG